MSRVLIPEESKEAARRLIRRGGMTNADIARQTGMSEMTVAKLKKDEANGGGNGQSDAAPVERQPTPKEKIERLEFALNLERMKNKYLRRHAKADNPDSEKEVEIEYLLARLALYGDDSVKRLTEEQDEDEEAADEDTAAED